MKETYEALSGNQLRKHAHKLFCYVFHFSYISSLKIYISFVCVYLSWKRKREKGHPKDCFRWNPFHLFAVFVGDIRKKIVFMAFSEFFLLFLFMSIFTLNYIVLLSFRLSLNFSKLTTFTCDCAFKNLTSCRAHSQNRFISGLAIKFFMSLIGESSCFCFLSASLYTRRNALSLSDK